MAGETSSHAASGERWSTDYERGDQEPGAVSSRSTSRPVTTLESDIRLLVPARPENVALVRHVLAAMAETLALPRAVTDDMRLAVTEACTNVVRHAYPDDDGNIDVILRPRGATLEVIVADDGRGPAPSPDTAGPGLGMPLIAALTDSLEIQRTASTGSRLVMSFLRTRATPAVGVA